MTPFEKLGEELRRQCEIRHLPYSEVEYIVLEVVKEHTEAIIKIGEDLMKDTHPMEDGVPVETYGYEETHNNALKDFITAIKQASQ